VGKKIMGKRINKRVGKKKRACLMLLERVLDVEVAQNLLAISKAYQDDRVIHGGR
jgi:hypothetical protein